MSYLNYEKIDEQFDISRTPLLMMENSLYESTDDFHCREEISKNFLEEIAHNKKISDLPDLNIDESKITMVQCVRNCEDSFKKNPKKIAYKKAEDFLKRFVDVSMMPFYSNKVNFISDVSIEEYENDNGSYHAKYLLSFTIPNKYFLGHGKMSYVLGMARLALGAIVFDDIKNIDNLMKKLSFSNRNDLTYNIFKDEFYTNEINSHPFNHETISIIRSLFKDDTISSKIFPNNNEYKKSWCINDYQENDDDDDDDDYDDDDEDSNLPDSDDLGFINACHNLR